MLKSVIIVAITILLANGNAAPSPSEQPDYEYFNSTINPGYGVRFVRPQLCDPSIRQYAGYLDMKDYHYHFWFFESNEDPTKKPLTSYFNGGPACTSHVAIWTENSPCKYSNDENPKIEHREQSWTKFSNMLYIDQPAGAGFSYGNYSTNTEEAAVVWYEAIQLFYEAFPQYSKLPYHLFGESFGGRMAPVFANYIVNQNLKLKESWAESNNTLASRQVIPLESVGSLSPWMNPLIQYESNTRACDLTYGSVIPPKVCELMKESYKTCKELTLKCYQTGSVKKCIDATYYCGVLDADVFYLSGRHTLDMRKSIFDAVPPRDYIEIIERPDIRKAIGVGSTPFTLCSADVKLIMVHNGEFSRDSTPVFESLLDHGVRILVAGGDTDYRANWVGLKESLLNLKFNGSELYHHRELKSWFVDHKEAGQVQSTDKLTFVRMYEAGHELPLDQPENSMVMFDNWINKKEFLYN